MWQSNLGDLAINYALLTPTSVLYWNTTVKLLNECLGDSEVQLVVGLFVVVAIYFLHDVFKNNAPTRWPMWFKLTVTVTEQEAQLLL